MVFPWPKKHNDEEDNEGGGDTSRQGQERSGRQIGRDDYQGGRREEPEEPTERTNLIPRDRPNNGYLAPDDPAVSPYNLWRIRILHGFTGFLLLVAFLWWLLLLISTFVTPPGMSYRGSGYFAFAYATLNVANILLGLVFFAVPSIPMMIWTGSMTLFLFVNMMLVICVPTIRREEGWVGMVSVISAFVLALYLVMQTRSVLWGKREEEERLTGRAEQRRPLREWIAVLLQMLLMTGLVIFTILFMSTLAMRARDATVKPPGKKYWVDNDKYQVHLQCIGKEDASTPTVLVEAGELPVEHTMQQWVDRAYVTRKIERYCIWDRPGVAWSENAPSPHSAGMSADVLGEALAIAGEDGPYVLVSAGVGGIYSRIFAGRHAGQIKGIMLVDALHEDLLSRVGSSGRGFKLWLRGIFSPLGIDRLGGAIFKGRTRADRVYGRSSYQSDKFLKASLQENLVAESMTLSDIKRANEGQNRTTPLVVVASGVETGRDKKWAQKQEELCRITDNLVFYKAIKGAPHEVWRKAEGSRILERELEKLVLGKH